MEGLISSFEVLGNSVDNILNDPLTSFIENEMSEVGTLKKKVSKAKDDYDSLISKSSKDEKKKEKTQAALEYFQETRTEYIFKLLSIKLSKKFEIVKILNTWMQNVLVHYDGGHKMLSRIENYIELVREKCKEKQNYSFDEKLIKKNVSDFLYLYSRSSRNSIEGTLYDFSRNRIGQKSWWIVFNGKIYKYKSYLDFNFKHSNDLLLFTIKKAIIFYLIIFLFNFYFLKLFYLFSFFKIILFIFIF